MLRLLKTLLPVQKSYLRADIQLHNKAHTEIRSCLQLRSTILGANNRLDVEKIMSYDRGNSDVSMIGQSALSKPPAFQCLYLIAGAALLLCKSACP